MKRIGFSVCMPYDETRTKIQKLVELHFKDSALSARQGRVLDLTGRIKDNTQAEVARITRKIERIENSIETRMSGIEEILSQMKQELQRQAVKPEEQRGLASAIVSRLE
jgi:hypothetical protein